MEQIQGVGTDPRTDLYSLGATLYHFVTGATPQDALTRAAAVVDGQPDPLSIPSEMNGNVRPAVAAVLLKAMALSRNQRHPSAAEMRHAMTAACSLVNAANLETAVIGAPRRPVPSPSQEQPSALVVPQPESEESDAEATLLEEEPASREDVHLLLSSGAAAFDAGEYAVAVEHWEAALKLSPDEPGVKESIDGARRRIRKEEGRKARVERLVAEGTAAFDAKRYEAAIDRWSEALTLSPDEPGVEASVKAARVAAEKQGQREAKAKHLVLEGTEAFDVGDYDLAIQRWTEVLTLSPDEPGIKKSIEAASQRRRELQEAKKEEKPIQQRQRSFLDSSSKRSKSRRSTLSQDMATSPETKPMDRVIDAFGAWLPTEAGEPEPGERIFFRMLATGLVISVFIVIFTVDPLDHFELVLAAALLMLILAGILFWTSRKR